MSFYSNLAATASRLLASKGQSVTFSREVSGTLDPVTGIISGATTTTFSGNGAAFDYNNSEIDGTVIKSGDIRLLVEALSTEPEQGDKCTVNSIDYRVMDVSPTNPAGTVVMYEVQLRK